MDVVGQRLSMNMTSTPTRRDRVSKWRAFALAPRCHQIPMGLDTSNGSGHDSECFHLR